MPAGGAILAFTVAALVVLVTPGPAVMYVVTRSLTQGTRAGLVSTLGLSAGAFVHVAAAVLGLSALLLASAGAFTAVKLLGAAYLVYLGVEAFRTAADRSGQTAGSLTDKGTSRSGLRLFQDGLIVNILNPKIAVFFLAFLPQFVDPTRGPVAAQLAFLGGLYCGLALITDGAYALLAGRLRGWFGRRLGSSPWPRRASGTVYIGLGVGAALAERP